MATCNGRNDYNFRRLRKLYARACEVTEVKKFAPCRWFYRNQSHKYFTGIGEYDDGVMKVNMKDNGGDPDSPINGRLSGLFFMASVQSGSKSGEPLPMSPFGPCRLLVPAEDLLNTFKSNLYFADFYCMNNSEYHYVTLVITVPGLKADQFCRTHLPVVDIVDNPFLFVDDDDTLCVTTKDRVLVEIFYTEDLDCTGYALRKDTPIIGKGHSTSGGIPKSRFCRMCNL